jgi:hypothetical protein
LPMLDALDQILPKNMRLFAWSSRHVWGIWHKTFLLLLVRTHKTI